jgi:hypothetical protein
MQHSKVKKSCQNITEAELVTYVLKLENTGYGTHTYILNLVNRFASLNGMKHPFQEDWQMARKDWVPSFPE